MIPLTLFSAEACATALMKRSRWRLAAVAGCATRGAWGPAWRPGAGKVPQAGCAQLTRPFDSWGKLRMQGPAGGSDCAACAHEQQGGGAGAHHNGHTHDCEGDSPAHHLHHDGRHGGGGGGDRQDTSAAKRFGIRSFVYSRRMPFHPQRCDSIATQAEAAPGVTLTSSPCLPAGRAWHPTTRAVKQNGVTILFPVWPNAGSDADNYTREAVSVRSAQLQSWLPQAEDAGAALAASHKEQGNGGRSGAGRRLAHQGRAAVQGLHVDEQLPRHRLLLEPCWHALRDPGRGRLVRPQHAPRSLQAVISDSTSPFRT